MYYSYMLSLLHLSVTVLTISPILVVEESRGAVEVCVTVISPDISCPISFQFELNIYATDGTAGKLES